MAKFFVPTAVALRALVVELNAVPPFCPSAIALMTAVMAETFQSPSPP